MNKNTVMALMAIPILLVSLVAKAGELSYPRVNLFPSNPAPGDSVLLQLVLGMHSNSCVPEYSDESFEIMPTDATVYPVTYLYLNYIERPGEGDLCLAVMTEYGPNFDLGALNPGKYYVFDGEDSVAYFNIDGSGLDETFTIDGVVSEDTRPLEIFQPLEEAKVYLQRMEYLGQTQSEIVTTKSAAPIVDFITVDSTLTDEKGSYSLTGTPGEDYRLSFRKEGYQEYYTSVFSLKGDVSVNAALLPLNASSIIPM